MCSQPPLSLVTMPKCPILRFARFWPCRYATVSLGPLLFALPLEKGGEWQYALQTGAALEMKRTAMPKEWDWPLESPVKVTAIDEARHTHTHTHTHTLTPTHPHPHPHNHTHTDI